jgi:hypothetical protein
MRNLIEKPLWLRIVNRTDESALLLDANGELGVVKTLIAPCISMMCWNQVWPNIVISKIHAGETLTAIVLSLQNNCGDLFVRANGRSACLGPEHCNFASDQDAVFDWATRLAGWTWADQLSGCSEPVFNSRIFTPKGITHENHTRGN